MIKIEKNIYSINHKYVMNNTINYKDLRVGKTYITITKCYNKNMTDIETIIKIEENFMNTDLVFVKTNKNTYQVFPNSTVDFYNYVVEVEKIKLVKSIILQPYTECPISYEEIADGDDITIINERFIFLTAPLEEHLKIRFKNPITNMEIKETDIKYYTAIILPNM
jgi:cytidylate kinase